MINNSLDTYAKFTNEKYAKKDEIIRIYGSAAIANEIWAKICGYRTKFNRTISLNTIAKFPYYVCYTPEVVNNLNNINSRLISLENKLAALPKSDLEKFLILNKREQVKKVGLFYGETLAEDIANRIANHELDDNQGVSSNRKKIIRYFNACESSTNDSVTDKNSLKKLSLNLNNENNFRISNSVASNYSSNLNANVNVISNNLIDSLLDNLFHFINDSRPNFALKAIVTYYYLNYVKPFESYNEEIALLLVKNILIQKDKYAFISSIPFELLLSKHDELEIEFKEVTRSNDLTYAVIKISKLMNQIIDESFDILTNLNLLRIKLETISADEPLPPQFAHENIDEKLIKNEDSSNKENLNKPQIKIVQPKRLSINHIETSLSEKDAKKFEKYLLEKNPELKPKQAHFYARHCTLGCYYTIQMFKKSEHVVYETARTSMDSLTNFGYYSKEQIKNKFVYVPKKREG